MWSVFLLGSCFVIEQIIVDMSRQTRSVPNATSTDFNKSETPGGYTPRKLGWGVCGPLPKSLTLCKTKICDFYFPIYDPIKNSIPLNQYPVSELSHNYGTNY